MRTCGPRISLCMLSSPVSSVILSESRGCTVAYDSTSRWAALMTIRERGYNTSIDVEKSPQTLP